MELINIRTQQTVNALQDGVIDAGVWNYDDILENHYLDNLKVVFCRKKNMRSLFCGCFGREEEQSLFTADIREKYQCKRDIENTR